MRKENRTINDSFANQCVAVVHKQLGIKGEVVPVGINLLQHRWKRGAKYEFEQMLVRKRIKHFVWTILTYDERIITVGRSKSCLLNTSGSDVGFQKADLLTPIENINFGLVIIWWNLEWQDDALTSSWETKIGDCLLNKFGEDRLLKISYTRF